MVRRLIALSYLSSLVACSSSALKITMSGERPMVLGITGGIAMGKSAFTEQLRSTFGVRVHDADAAVHRLYGVGGRAVGPVAAAFGEEVLGSDGSIDRKKLSAVLQRAKTDENPFARLEGIVHPLVTQDRAEFIEAEALAGRWLCAVDIPLLFETLESPKLEAGIDRVAVASCMCEKEQRRRALKRPHMTEAKLEFILKRQLSDDIRIGKADFLVDTSHCDKAASKSQIATIMKKLYEERPPRTSSSLCCVTLDLDDTLWPTKPAIAAVGEKSNELMPRLMPKTFAALKGASPYEGIVDFGNPLNNLEGDDRRLAHDITALRRLALHKRAVEFGDSLENADLLLEAIVETRSRAAVENLLPEALDLISELRLSFADVKVGALTNGNARPYGALAGALDFWLGAPDIGAQKPHLTAFLAAAAKASDGRTADPRSLIHVGDNLHDDAIGALRAGARAILVPRPRNPTPFDTSKLKEFDPDRWAIANSLKDVPTIIRDKRWL